MEKKDLVIGKKYIIISSGSSCCSKGDILEYIFDDGTDSPKFKNLITGEQIFKAVDTIEPYIEETNNPKFKIGDKVKIPTKKTPWNGMSWVLEESLSFKKSDNGYLIISNYYSQRGTYNLQDKYGSKSVSIGEFLEKDLELYEESIPIDPYKELKEAHAKGKIIQYLSPTSNKWTDIKDPGWLDGIKYRIKPDNESKEELKVVMSDGIEPQVGMWVIHRNGTVQLISSIQYISDRFAIPYDQAINKEPGVVGMATNEPINTSYMKATNLEVALYIQRHNLWENVKDKLGFLEGLVITLNSEKIFAGINNNNSYIIGKSVHDGFYFGTLENRTCLEACLLSKRNMKNITFSTDIEKVIDYNSKPEIKTPVYNPPDPLKLPDWVFPGVMFTDNDGAIKTVLEIDFKNNTFSTKFFTTWDIKHIKRYNFKPLPYEEAQALWIKENDVKIDDSIKVVRKCASRFGGWKNSWDVNDGMRIDLVHKFCSNEAYYGLYLDDGFKYPYFCLEKVQQVTNNIHQNSDNQNPTLIKKKDLMSFDNYLLYQDIKNSYTKKEEAIAESIMASKPHREVVTIEQLIINKNKKKKPLTITIEETVTERYQLNINLKTKTNGKKHH